MNDLGNWISEHAWVAWVSGAIVLSIVELLSLDLVLLMFALGALAAAVAAGLGAPIWVCIPVFALVSLLLLFFARPAFVAKLHDGPTLLQGPDRLVGHTAVVIDRVDWRGGRIELGGENWSARTTSESESYEPGADVLVTKIDGASAVVTGKA